MSAAKNKSLRYERIFRRYFPKLILIAAAAGTFLMLQARLRQSPMGRPPEDPVAFYQKDKFPVHVVSATLGADTSHAVSNELDEIQNEPEHTFEIPLDALTRFLSDGTDSPRTTVLGPERPPLHVANKPGVRPKTARSTSPEAKRESLPISIEANWDVSLDGDAVNDTSPLTSIFYESLSDAPLMGSYDADTMISSVHLNVESKPATAVLPEIPRLRTLIGIVKQNSFENERSHLSDLNTQFTDTELPPFQREILPNLMAETQPPQSIIDRPIPSIIDKSPSLDARQAMEELEAQGSSVRGERLTVQSESPRLNEAEATWQPKPSVAVAANSLSGNMTDDVQVLTASPDSLRNENMPQSRFVAEHGRVHSGGPKAVVGVPVPSSVEEEAKMNTQNLSNHPVTPAGDISDRGGERIGGNKILGELDLTEDAIHWLESKKGHIELYLQGPKARDSQDIIFLSYTYPASEFEIDTTVLRRPYQLSAAVYLPGSSQAFSTMVYPHFISQDTHQRRIRFNIEKAQLIQRRAARGSDNSVSLTMTIFEALSGNYRHPSAVAGAQVELVGMGVDGKFVSSPEGTVRIASLATRSEYLIRVSAPGFLPTEKIIPVFDGPEYTTVYLVPEPKVADITRYFNKSPQKHVNSVLIGRSFDPVTRIPKANEQFKVSFRKSGPIYFGALPDPSLKQTTEQGLFGFFNIIPSARVLSRENGPYGMLTNCRAGHGYYVEWGRGGEKSIFGRVEDPFNLTPLNAKISWVGKSDGNVETDHSNRFEFSKVDLPPGVVTLEIDIEGYPTTWHTVSWSTRERADEHILYVLEKDLIRESTKRFSRRETSQEVGAVIGGAAGGFFKRAECIQVELLSADGVVVDVEHGPYYFSKKRGIHEKFCLTSKHPGFSYVNLIPGEYIMRFYEDTADRERKLVRSKIVRIGANRVSIAVQ